MPDGRCAGNEKENCEHRIAAHFGHDDGGDAALPVQRRTAYLSHRGIQRGGLYRMASGGVFHRGCECIYADQRLFSGGIGF